MSCSISGGNEVVWDYESRIIILMVLSCKIFLILKFLDDEKAMHA